MAEIVVMPQAGNSVESCIVVSWRVSEGDTVAVGDILCEIETDKATIEVESTAAGTVLKRYAEEGDEVPVKDPLVAVGDAGESAPGTDGAAGAGETAGGKAAG
ncbi:MAG: biotin/lipoyl-containing protein, partial [Alkalispirochaeta sp.]